MIVDIAGLEKRYGETAVFSGVNLQVHAGEFIAIVGDSGVGKSTLLNCMAGLDGWDAGSLHVQGADLGAMSDEQLALWRRSAVGFVFQAFHVLPHLDVAQNVGLPLLLLGHKPAQITPRVEQMLQAVGLQGLGTRLPQQLSGGQLQRVAIARALVHAPALVLADEPTGNLDPSTAELVLNTLIEQSRSSQAALILVTHSEAASSRADRVLHLTSTGIAARHAPPAA
ncbi:MAG: ABC transporter ATP-binding protein [Brachymonas sp.]|nr:ABC transporter ATP-binding protein [Brachymonas sp.]